MNNWWWLALIALAGIAVVCWLVWRVWFRKPETEFVRLDGAARMGAAAQRVERPADVPVLEVETLGPYRIERQLGRGSMGVVFLGRVPETGAEVALKTMALAREFDPEQLEEARIRFFREAETAARLHHSGIVSVIESGEDQGLAWIAMEFLHGEPLTLWTEKTNLLPLPEALSVVRQTAIALDHAHKHQVVHRDIKPANILYDREKGKVKVTDFGVARLTDSCRTRTGLVLGTPAFMSPEQLAGKHIDSRSDLFSLGVMLYQLITGHLPFKGASLGELMNAIVHKAPDDPRLLNPRLPAVLSEIVMKALQKDVSARFQNGAQMALVLVRLEAALREKKMQTGAKQNA